MNNKTIEKQPRLTHPVRTRVTEKTHEMLQELKATSNCRSIGEVARKILSREKILCFYTDTTMNAPMEELASIRKELKSIGVNINQQTRHFHTAESELQRSFHFMKTSDLYKNAMENGKINYVEKDFGRIFRNPPLPQTIWVDRGKGFTAPQAINLIEGRAVYREDMLTQGGMPYKAWMKLDLDGPRDRHMNYNMNQYHDPSYGFNLKEVLDKFKIKELETPKEREKLESQLKNGDRPAVTVEKNGEPLKVFVEAVPRYSQLNMYTSSGRPEKREQFLKQPSVHKEVSKAKTKEKGISEAQGLGV